MQEVIAQVLTYVWGVWRYKWSVLIIAWLVAIAGWVYVWRMPEYYVATARLYVDTNSVLRPLLQGLAITPDVNRRVQMMSGTLFSRPNLEKLSRMTDLDLQTTTDESREALIDRLRESISLTGQRGNASIYNIEVTDREREVARRIAQSLITVFIESSLNEKRDDSTDAQDFLDEQIADYERRLIEAESRLARFKQQNVDVLPGSSGGDFYSRLERIRRSLSRFRLELEELTNRRDALDRQLRGEGEAGDAALAASIVTPTDARIQEMRIQLDSLLTRYTEKHPQVRQLQGLIEELTVQRDEERKALLEGGVALGGDGSNAYLDVRTLKAEADASVAELQVRVKEYERREENLASKVNQIPEVEAQLKQLDRDYSVVRQQHEQLLKRRESARISEDVETNASDVTFRVIDPPFVPLEASEPDKPLLNLAVLVLAFATGVGFALLRSLLRPIVVDARMLAQITELPLLGVVTDNKAAAQRRRDRFGLAAFAIGNVLLLVGLMTAIRMPVILPL